MSAFFDEKYDIAVIGAGHAGCEAALACARMGLKTLVLCIDLDSVALMACNPSIGGTSKGHLVREVDALGGEMGLAADDCFIQMRMLNTGKGPAVRSLRAQMDKRRYHERMKAALESEPNVTLRQDECARILTENGAVFGIETALGASYACRAAVVCSGVYLKSRVHTGEYHRDRGPSGLASATQLSDSLKELGFELRRFKTGTPPRVAKASLDLSRTEPQYGDFPIPHFSFMTDALEREQVPCHLTYTNEKTHEIIRQNLNRSPMYSGSIHATGTRYCPSIEDKIVRFADKDRHQLFIEPEGLTTDEMYVQGLSTSLPRDVQEAMLRTIPGLENCRVMRYGYAIEYDCIDPTELTPFLMSRRIPGLFFAGQINGSSGYEEAAAQGIYAGINAALAVKGEAPLVIGREEAYLGVLCDDLTDKGTNEPYRMMTCRAEYRMLLRQNNADMRLTEKALGTGLVSPARYDRLMRKKEEIRLASGALKRNVPASEALTKLLTDRGSADVRGSTSLEMLLKRSGITYTDLLAIYELPAVSDEAREEVEAEALYGGYVKRQQEQIEKLRRMEKETIPTDIDYMAITNLRTEARQKLTRLRPVNLGAAARISGVSPADIAVLSIYLKSRTEDENAPR
ncbi:MAG: tRNA uridine-5-carboxymethylaminomethyl(34) synthesis enzyme MnmG [Clostridiales bacterium]|nr:tRNA uridine-5-carboxymethylaminomethyl(34) synthesis enzyme MnmG [Clostridiales bacterium]